MSANEIARAYDGIASNYDLQLEGDRWMREALWEHYLRRFPRGARLLDVSCGTGLDSLFLAERGMAVTGMDISPGMISQLREKASRAGLSDRIEAHVADYAGLGSWPSRNYDGIVSAFAGLNTAPDLGEFSRHAAGLLRPNGRMVLHLLNRFSLWEWAGMVRDGRWSEARRLGSTGERRFSIGDLELRHHVFYPRDAYSRYFSREFLLDECYGVGFLRPPHTIRRIPPAVIRGLGALERPLGSHRPFRNWGRFFVLDLRLRPDASR